MRCSLLRIVNSGYTFNSYSLLYGFAALPGGNRNTDGTTFNNEGNNANFWSSSENDGTNAYNLNLNYNNTNANLNRNNKANGFSVRCLKD